MRLSKIDHISTSAKRIHYKFHVIALSSNKLNKTFGFAVYKI